MNQQPHKLTYPQTRKLKNQQTHKTHKPRKLAP